MKKNTTSDKQYTHLLKLNAKRKGKKFGKNPKLSKSKKEYYKDNTVWNKGLTKETSEIIKKYSEKLTGMKKPDLALRYKGKGNPHYKNGIITGKRMILEIHRVCEECNSEKNLEVHHIDENRKHNEIENLKLLCKSCHSKVHRGNKEWYDKITEYRRLKQNGRLVC